VETIIILYIGLWHAYPTKVKEHIEQIYMTSIESIVYNCTYERKHTCFTWGLECRHHFPLSCIALAIPIAFYNSTPPPVNEDDLDDEDDLDFKSVYMSMSMSMSSN
jgi:hypothetical protein